MTTQIRTTHVGSLPRTPRLLGANRARMVHALDPQALAKVLTEEVSAVVERQAAAGIDVVNDGEYGHPATQAIDYGSWWTYTFERIAGIELISPSSPAIRPRAGRRVRIHLADNGAHRDWSRFPTAYTDPASGLDSIGAAPSLVPAMTGPLEYTGQDQVRRDVAALTHALDSAAKPYADGFLAAISPGSLARIANACYADDEAQLAAAAEVLRTEYRTITDAGLTVQIDAPDLAESWDQINPEPTLADYRQYTGLRVEALNYALEGIDPAQVRLHVCWGSWRGPHTTDLDFREVVDLTLAVNAAGLSFEAANARHAHEWRIWEELKLPEGKHLVPGVVTHATSVVEHPELVADRIEQFARLVGPERVLASTDCGLGGRVHAEIAWAKLDSLAQGAKFAATRLAHVRPADTRLSAAPR
ncbi:cobalamin-independent methionine synthase II family protein [Actinomyces trachealis]|uniref:cobalamin-independent methionine synthase II family protein n=1 Tax=Actinomyces trachealis TaxID=2763540 RepID=UPI001892C92F|nr:cobalamin-independent methionine synthase II family protein [Actinomyces trachealis]